MAEAERTEQDTKMQWTDLFDAAEKLHELFKSLMVGGFTEYQALRIVAFVMTGNTPPALDG